MNAERGEKLQKESLKLVEIGSRGSRKEAVAII